MKGSRPLSQSEVAAVMAHLAEAGTLRERALFALGVSTGLRISELLSLRVGQVIQHGRFVKRIAVERRHVKHRREGRAVLLHPTARSALGDWLAHLGQREPLGPVTYVFKSRTGTNRPISRVQGYRLLQAAFDALGLNGRLGCHALRKTHAAFVYEATGHDLLSVQAALGHKSILTTAAYLSFKQDVVDEAILGINLEGEDQHDDRQQGAVSAPHQEGSRCPSRRLGTHRAPDDQAQRPGHHQDRPLCAHQARGRAERHFALEAGG